MKTSVMLDTNVGPIGRPAPTRDEISTFHEWFLACGRQLDDTAVAGLFLPERHGRTDCFSPAPLDLVAALAGATTTPRLGTYVMMPPLYPPVALLERLAVLDHLSDGRLVMGFGAGFHPGYFAVHDRPMAGRGRALDHFLDLMDEGWSTGVVNHEGEEIYVVPPQQQPRPELWIGGASEPAVRRAARRGDAFGIGFTDQRIRHLLDVYHEECEAVGREPRRVLIQSAWVSEDGDPEQQVLEYLGETLGPEMTLYQDHGQLEANGTITAERMLPYMYVGGVEQTTERLARDAERFQVEEIVLRVHIGIPPQDAVHACLDHIANDIAPALA